MQRHANKDQYMQTAPNKLSIPSNNYLAAIKEVVVLDVLEKEAVRTQITNSLRPEKTSQGDNLDSDSRNFFIIFQIMNLSLIGTTSWTDKDT